MVPTTKHALRYAPPSPTASPPPPRGAACYLSQPASCLPADRLPACRCPLCAPQLRPGPGDYAAPSSPEGPAYTMRGRPEVPEPPASPGPAGQPAGPLRCTALLHRGAPAQPACLLRTSGRWLCRPDGRRKRCAWGTFRYMRLLGLPCLCCCRPGPNHSCTACDASQCMGMHTSWSSRRFDASRVAMGCAHRPLTPRCLHDPQTTSSLRGRRGPPTQWPEGARQAWADGAGMPHNLLASCCMC